MERGKIMTTRSKIMAYTRKCCGLTQITQRYCVITTRTRKSCGLHILHKETVALHALHNLRTSPAIPDSKSQCAQNSIPICFPIHLDTVNLLMVQFALIVFLSYWSFCTERRHSEKEHYYRCFSKQTHYIRSTILEKSNRTAGDTYDLWEIEMDEMQIMISNKKARLKWVHKIACIL